MIALSEDTFDPKDLLIDPNNYRFQDIDGFVYAAEERFHEETVQKKAYQRIREEESLQELKNSIMRKGAAPLGRWPSDVITGSEVSSTRAAEGVLWERWRTIDHISPRRTLGDAGLCCVPNPDDTRHLHGRP